MMNDWFDARRRQRARGQVDDRRRTRTGRVTCYYLLETCVNTRWSVSMWKGPWKGSDAGTRAYYAEFVERVAPEIYGADELVWRTRIASDFDNLRSAVTWALDRDESSDAEYAMRIIGALIEE